MLRAPQIIAALMMMAQSSAVLAQKSTGHMELDDMRARGGPAIARVAISKTDADCPYQTGMIRIGTRGGVKDTVVVLGGKDWTIDTAAPDPDDFSFRRRLAADSCRIDIDVSKQQQRNGDWVALSKQSPEPPNDRTPKINERSALPSAENVFDRYDRARASAGSLRQGVLGIFRSSLWKGEVQDCFEAVGIYLIDQSGVTLLFPTDLGGELNRFFLERVDVDADHSTIYLRAALVESGSPSAPRSCARDPGPRCPLCHSSDRSDRGTSWRQETGADHQIKMHAEAELAKFNTGLDSKIALGAHLKALTEAKKMQHAQERHRMDVADAALGIAAAAASHQTKTRKTE